MPYAKRAFILTAIILPPFTLYSIRIGAGGTTTCLHGWTVSTLLLPESPDACGEAESRRSVLTLRLLACDAIIDFILEFRSRPWGVRYQCRYQGTLYCPKRTPRVLVVYSTVSLSASCSASMAKKARSRSARRRTSSSVGGCLHASHLRVSALS